MTMAQLQSDHTSLVRLKKNLEGSLHTDETMRMLYATDASAYRELPEAVALPKNKDDILKLIRYARDKGTSLIPRTAGTSLAGQVVGQGIVVDLSYSMTGILEINEQECWVRVQPGVIRDDLNNFLRPYGLYFAPETSTANRAMIGGMVGNNSCGSNSIIYGSTRDHVLELTAFLSNGEEALFKPLDRAAFERKLSESDSTLEGSIYREMHAILRDSDNRASIQNGYPRPDITRRNTGYALDQLLETAPLDGSSTPFNFCKLLAGSEGTLAFITEIKLNLVPLPPDDIVLVCAHFHDVIESLEANLIALKYEPRACELMDHYILECTKNNIIQRKNRFFVRGDPGAILAIDLSRHNKQEALDLAENMIAEMKSAGKGYHFPIVAGEDASKVWNLRKAGLGLLSNMPGDAKPVPVIEDTAVHVEDLPDYIREFNEVLKKHGLYSVHYAHAGSGELHLRPILNLKDPADTKMFRTIAEEIAVLVKKYGGSLSGEHGDGRLRGEFIPRMLGEKNFELIRHTKAIWDPQNIFNPGKIVDTPPMDSALRYTPGMDTPQFDTYFRFDQYQGIVRSAELCNGSGDCRKTHISGGTMCPSYMATKLEKDTTRARANILREVLTTSTALHPFDSAQIGEVMDLCLSCKGCKSECPSNVDVAKLKAEFLQQYYDVHGVPLRSKMIAAYTRLNALASKLPGVYNFVASHEPFASLIKIAAGFSRHRSLPLLHTETLRNWYGRYLEHQQKGITNFRNRQTVYLFCDEFSNYNDVPIGIAAVELLERLGYRVVIPEHSESGRACISKGLLKKARAVANENVRALAPFISDETPLLGIEPSAILTFRDEYPVLVEEALKPAADKLAPNCMLIDEFIDSEMERGNISKTLFTTEPKKIKLHGHCHQKSLSSLTHTKRMLQFPENYTVEVIPSGCCGMAGSFGFEREHYQLSMQIGELVLFPAVRNLPSDVDIAAPGTSCRHQIKDGTGRTARHPVEILLEALRK
jgi:FAD/FMN-containing dehydrogenase/Fe-S oxidoreductase